MKPRINNLERKLEKRHNDLLLQLQTWQENIVRSLTPTYAAAASPATQSHTIASGNLAPGSYISFGSFSPHDQFSRKRL